MQPISPLPKPRPTLCGKGCLLRLIHPLLLCLLNVLLLAKPYQSGKVEQTHPDSKAFLSWVREQAIHLDIRDPLSEDLTHLNRFDSYLEGKRIVFLGEPDHYIRQKLEYQLLLIRYLQSKGFHHIGIESGPVQGRMLDRYIETGDRIHLEKYGAIEDISRPDRDDIFPILRAVLNSDNGRRMRDAGMWFLSSLYKISSAATPGTERLRFFGFDIEPLPNICYGEIDLLLEPWQPLADVVVLQERLATVEGESRLEERDRIESILSDVRAEGKKWVGLIGKERFGELVYLLKVLADSLANLDLAFTDTSSWLPDREEKILRNLNEWLASLSEDEKVVLMAHNLHLARNSEEVRVDTHQLWTMIGTHLSRRYAEEIYGIWMLYDRGRHGRVSTQRGGELIVEEIASDPARVEHLLARAGSVFLLPLGTADRRAAYLNQRLNFVQNGRSASGVLPKQTDAIFFVSEVAFIGK